jgi:CBS-domain-containing membrane protein
MVRKLAYSVSEREQWISAAGGVLGILAVWWISDLLLDTQGAVLVASSMGSTAVMLFASPHGPMSQPWPLIGGHLVSALAGVACVHWLGSDHVMTAPLAVGLAIAAMYSLRCLHPPGGATALGAVLGGETAHALGYGYVVSPILLNALVILAVAVAFNYPFAWRRYPQCWHRRTEASAAPVEESMIPHSNLVYALSQIDTFVDVSEEDLQRIYALALGQHHEAAAPAAGQAQPAESLR